MFKACMKSYFGNLKYVFVALGVMFIMLIIGTQGMVNKSVKEIKTMAAAIDETTKSSDLSLTRIGDSVKNTVTVAKENVSPAVLMGIEEPAEVEESIEDAISTVVENYLAYLSEIIEYMATALAGIFVAIILFVVVQILGLFLSDAVITMFGRYDVSHDNIFRIILEQLVRGLFIILLIAIIAVGYTINMYVGLAMTALYPLGFCFIALLSAWVTAGKAKRPEWGQYVTFVNMLVLLGANIVQLLISAVFAVAVYFIGGTIMAVVFGLALVVLASANANLNAYVFLHNLPEIQAEKAAKKAKKAEKAKTFEAEIEAPAAEQEKPGDEAVEAVIIGHAAEESTAEACAAEAAAKAENAAEEAAEAAAEAENAAEKAAEDKKEE